MSFAALIDALALPADARVDQRVPKKVLLEHGMPTPADRRLVQDGVEELRWIAALKPNNIGVPVYRDDAREYLEIQVLTLTLREGAREGRLAELVHRAIPYPVALVSGHGRTASFSLAHKRWSQGQANKVVTEDVRQTGPFLRDEPTGIEAAFLDSLSVARQPNRDIFALYDGWVGCIDTLEAARITGSFVLPRTPEAAAQARAALHASIRLKRDIAALRAQAVKEKQINRRVELNLQIKRLEAELTALISALRSEVSHESH